MTQGWLQVRIVAAILAAALLPLSLAGIGSWLVFERLLEERTLDLHRQVVEHHAATIDMYLAERRRALELATLIHQLEELREGAGLEQLFTALNRGYEGTFVDLGVIDEEGHHVAYIGPYELADRNYAEEDWFRHVMIHGAHISDVFLGFRGVPHCVIAVRQHQNGVPWILRATINSDQFDRLVRTHQLGQTGDVFLLNREGIYQTPPRSGRVLTASPIPSPESHRGVSHSRVELDGDDVVLRSTIWLNRGRWMLVVQQTEEEIRAPARQALLWGGVVVLTAFLLLVVTTVVATKGLANRIRRANEQKEALARDLLRSSRLASIGELATGLAHEINNPLAIISAEKTNLSDVLGELDQVGESATEEMRESIERIGRQVQRAGTITAKMLQFGRHEGRREESIEIAGKLREIVELLQRQATLRNIELSLELDQDLPPLTIDVTELQQVLVNLINNSLHALESGGHIVVQARRIEREVELTVTDDGPGIPASDLDHIFQPFFTTKPVGQGTGLGLSVCFGLVRGWGGTISVESEVGQGTTMRIRAPLGSTGAVTRIPEKER